MKISWKAMAVLTVIVAALLSYGVYYTQGMPTEEYTVATLCTYEQNTKCDYIAYLKPNILYGEVIGENKTIYMNLVNRIDVTFHYTFECSETGNITTEYRISSLVADPSEAGWSKSIDELVSVEKSETNTTTSAALEAKFSYNINEIRELIDRIEEDVGVTSSTYQVITKVMINTTDETSVGTVSKPIEESVVLSFNPWGGVITVEVPERHLLGSITENSTREIASAVQLRTAMYIAWIAWIAVALSFTAWRYKVGKAKFETLPESEKIMKRFKVIESRDMPKLKVQTLSSMEALKKVADDYDSIIFHSKTSFANHIFFTTAENITYQYIAKPVQKTE